MLIGEFDGATLGWHGLASTGGWWLAELKITSNISMALKEHETASCFSIGLSRLSLNLIEKLDLDCL